MGRKLKQNGHCPSIYFQLFDESKWEMIDRLMTLPKYAKSRTSLINNALDLGLPLLIEREFGEVKIESDYPITRRKRVQTGSQNVTDDLLKEIIRLLSEVVMNTTITKTMLCGLYQAKDMELAGQTVRSDRFSKGKYNYTPNCLYGMEIDLLKDVIKGRKEE